MSNGPQKVTDPIFVSPPAQGLLNNAKLSPTLVPAQCGACRGESLATFSAVGLQTALKRFIGLRTCPPATEGFSGLRPEIGKKQKQTPEIAFGMARKIGEK